jgi:hypothetical protein
MKEKIDTFEFHLSLRIQHFFVNFAFKFGQESQIEMFKRTILSSEPSRTCLELAGPARIFLRPDWMMPTHALRLLEYQLSRMRLFKDSVNT